MKYKDYYAALGLARDADADAIKKAYRKLARAQPHALFRTDGHDLYFELDLAPWEAALGVDIEVPTLDGPVLLTVPPGSRSGRKLRMRGRGLATGHHGRGDLHAVVQVDVPATLAPRERELFEELSRVSTFNPRRIAGKEVPHAR